MKSPQSYLLAFLVIAVVGGGVLAWQQHLDLIELRASAMDPDERRELRERLAAAEARARDLESQLAALRPVEDIEDALTAVTNEERPSEPGSNNRGNRPRGGPGGDAVRREAVAQMAAAMESPEVQRAIALQHRAGIEARYADLFKHLHLPPEQLEKFKTLLVERQTASTDVMSAARSQGLDPRTDRDAIRQLVQSTQAEIDASIKATLGQSGYDQYKTYEQTAPQRNLVNQLERRLSYTNTPLNDSQSQQLVQILAASSEQRNQAATGGMNFNNGGRAPGQIVRGGGTQITTSAVNQAQGVLTTQQLQILQQMQQEQQAQQEMQQILRQASDSARAKRNTNAAKNKNSGGTGTSGQPKPTTAGGG